MTKRRSASSPVMGAEIMAEWNHPRHMTPYLPSDDRVWQERATETIMEAARLQQAVNPRLRAALLPLLGIMNCYYSNLIEGHRTYPRDIENAMEGAAISDAPKTSKELLIEAQAHIYTQDEIARVMATTSDWNPTSADSIQLIHRIFTERLPENMRWNESPGGKLRMQVVPGEYRTGRVSVGRHDPPAAMALPLFLEAFGKQYGDHAKASPLTMAKIAAAHHRFAWIHPFVDGNGRVARLITDAMLERAGIGAGGLWRISRGFARKLDDYKRYLANADSPRRGDLDGRGNLSQRGLDDWCGFVLDQVSDQIRFMLHSIDAERLSERVRATIDAKYPRHGGQRTGLLVAHVMREGAVDRSLAQTILGVGDRQTRNVVNELLADDIVGVEPTGTMVPKITVKTAQAWFPGLFPPEER